MTAFCYETWESRPVEMVVSKRRAHAVFHELGLRKKPMPANVSRAVSRVSEVAKWAFFSHLVARRLSNNLWAVTPSANALANVGVSGDRRHAHGTPYISGSWPRSRSPVDPVDQQLRRPAELSRRGNVRLRHSRPGDEAHGPVSVLDHAPGDLK